MRVDHETFEGQLLEAQDKMNAWLARNPGVRVISVETLTREYSQSIAAIHERPVGVLRLRVWFEGERADD